MKKAVLKKVFLISVPLLIVILVICLVVIPKLKSTGDDTKDRSVNTPGQDTENTSGKTSDIIRDAVDFEHELSTYQPKKDHYNFYFTYKTVHAWWDAVALGMEEAQRQYLDKGIVITYEYMAPNGASADDQVERLHKADQVMYERKKELKAMGAKTREN